MAVDEAEWLKPFKRKLVDGSLVIDTGQAVVLKQLLYHGATNAAACANHQRCCGSGPCIFSFHNKFTFSHALRIQTQYGRC